MSIAGKIANGKICTTYKLFDLDAIHCYINGCFACWVEGLTEQCGTMIGNIPNTVYNIMIHRQLYLNTVLRSITTDHVSVEPKYIIYDFICNYDVIIGKHWMTAYPHAMNYFTNTFYMLSYS
jgi:hypothetical protein